jgi:outer membrane receptor for ferrienterochelin and colicin
MRGRKGWRPELEGEGPLTFTGKAPRRAAALGAIIAGMAAAVQPAHAQDQPGREATTEEEIVVTGSRIRRNDLASAAPIQILGGETIDNTGVTNVAGAINVIPGIGVPISPVVDQPRFGTGRNFVNIFNLGSQRTLTLVNGRRFVSSNATQVVEGIAAQGQQVDLNAIPTALIDRIEIIQAGGAAV